MNICIISRELYPYQKAGIGVYVHSLSNLLARNGNKVFIITDSHPESQENYFYENVQLVSIDASNWRESSFFANFNLFYAYKVYLALRKLAAEHSIDIVEVSDYFAEGFFILSYKKYQKEFSDIPIVLKLHTPSYECNVANGIESPINNITQQEDFCIQSADFVYSISDALRNKVKNRLSYRAPIKVIYNPLELSAVSEETNVCCFDNFTNKTILYVGRLQKLKGVDILVSAALKIIDRFPETRFLFIGKDSVDPTEGISMKQLLEDMIPENKSHYFQFFDAVDREQLTTYYSQAYVSVFPSRWEGFGNVCIEAMHCGSPVIVSDAGGMMEIIENGQAGLYFKSEDVESLIEKLELILRSNQVHEDYKSRAIIRSKTFSVALLYQEQMKFYTRVVEDYKPLQIEYSPYKDTILEDRLLKNLQSSYTLYETLVSEHNGLLLERNQLVEEKLALHEKMQQLNVEFEQLTEQLNRTLLERNHLTLECNNLVLERDRLAHQYETLKGETTSRKWLITQFLSLWGKKSK